MNTECRMLNVEHNSEHRMSKVLRRSSFDIQIGVRRWIFVIHDLIFFVRNVILSDHTGKN